MDVIYADEVFLRNALLDALLLLLSARLLSRRIPTGRLLSAGALGGAYALLCALPPLRALGTFPAALGMSALLCLAAFGKAGFGRCWGAFLSVAALLAGAVLALGRMLEDTGDLRAVSPALVWLCFALCYALVRFLLPRLRREGRQKLRVLVRLGGREAELTALRDTGNALTDPLTGAPVLITDGKALAPLFSPPLGTLPQDGAELFRRLAVREELRGRLRLLPYYAVGTASGLLPAFRADGVWIEGEETACLVALSPTVVGGEDYNALI